MKNIKCYKIEKYGFKAEITNSFGAHILSLSYNGKNVYLPLESDEQLLANRFLHGSPILLPANRTVDGKFTFEEKAYSLPINESFNNCNLHGELYLEDFNLKDLQNDSIVFEYVNIGKNYPFPFKLEVKYFINDNGFNQNYKITNIGKQTMPYTFALHTTFEGPKHFSVPIALCTPRNEETYLPIGDDIPLNTKQLEYKNGYNIKGEKITGYYTSCGNTVLINDFIYTVSDNFDHWVLYGDEDGKFICIEPQKGAVNGLNIENGHGIIRINETVEFNTSVKPKQELI